MKGTGQVSAHDERNLVSILLKMMKETGQVSAHDERNWVSILIMINGTGQVSAHDERNRDKSSNHFKRN